MRTPLEQVLSDLLGEASVADRLGHPHDAKLLRRVVGLVKESSAEEYLTWLSEKEAVLRSGKRVEWLRKRFPGWERQQLARLNGRHRQYRMAALPPAVNLDAARAQGRRAVLGQAS
jgi:hypothetical protein